MKMTPAQMESDVEESIAEDIPAPRRWEIGGVVAKRIAKMQLEQKKQKDQMERVLKQGPSAAGSLKLAELKISTLQRRRDLFGLINKTLDEEYGALIDYSIASPSIEDTAAEISSCTAVVIEEAPWRSDAEFNTNGARFLFQGEDAKELADMAVARYEAKHEAEMADAKADLAHAKLWARADEIMKAAGVKKNDDAVLDMNTARYDVTREVLVRQDRESGGDKAALLKALLGLRGMIED